MLVKHNWSSDIFQGKLLLYSVSTNVNCWPIKTKVVEIIKISINAILV